MINQMFFLWGLDVPEYPGRWSSTQITLSGWWFEPLGKILVNWDDQQPNRWENKIDVPNHQPGYIVYVPFWVDGPC